MFEGAILFHLSLKKVKHHIHMQQKMYIHVSFLREVHLMR